MNKFILNLSLFALVATQESYAERLLIDPAKVGTLRCDDTSFKNDPYTLDGPAQEFVFNSSDGQTHSVSFKNHEECRAKMQFVKSAQIDSTHPWVKIETSSLSFAMVSPPERDQTSARL